MRDRTEPGADHDAGDGLPEGHAEREHREHADEDRRELEVGRGPRPEQLAWPPVPIGFGDVFVSSGFHRDDAVAVGALGGGLGDSHRNTVTPEGSARNPNQQHGNNRRADRSSGDVKSPSPQGEHTSDGGQ